MAEYNMTSAQCRGARGMLDWSRQELAVRAKVAAKTIANFESDAHDRPHDRTLVRIGKAFERAGVAFVKLAGAPGVVLRKRRGGKLKGQAT